MFWRYIKKVKKSLLITSLFSSWFFIVSITELPTTLIILTYSTLAISININIFNLLIRFNPNPVFFTRKKILYISRILGFAGGFILLDLVFPHLFLFIHALPIFFAIPLVTLCAFFFIFELSLRMPNRQRSGANLGERYSLIKIIFNPIANIAKLRALLVPEQTLKLSQAEENKLKLRQEKALKELKNYPGAIINDMALYNKYKANLFAGKTQAELTVRTRGLTLAQKLQGDVLDATTEEAENLENNFMLSLSSAQKTAYTNYRALVKSLNAPYASCQISGCDFLDTPNNQFIVLEKRVHHADSIFSSEKLSYLMHLTTGLLPSLNMTEGQGTNGTEIEPFNPFNSEPLILPNPNSAYPGSETEYRYHPYGLIEEHGLSLQMCEEIEALNLSLKPVLNQQRAVVHVSHLNIESSSAVVPNYRVTSSLAPPSVIENSLFEEQKENDIKRTTQLDDVKPKMRSGETAYF